MKRILAIGAYERDNFGDLLFYILTKVYFKDALIVPASIIYADMRTTLGEIVLPYKILLEKYKWDAVITVGGEVGGVNIDSALHMALSGGVRGVYWHSDVSVKTALRSFLMSPQAGQAYIPDISAYNNTHKLALILNSVGLSNADFSDEQLIKTLNDSKYIAVRDKKSYQLLKNNDISSVLVPDLVHSIMLKWPFDQKSKDYIIFQISNTLADKYGINTIAQALVIIATKHRMRVVMIAAGTAPLHDSFEQYEKIAKRANDVLKRQLVSINRNREPLKIVELIACSKLWIGSSLHGRIISIAYSVPRVSLKVDKVSDYAECWDNQFPHGVEINNPEDLNLACNLALNLMSDNKMKKIAMTLADSADSNMKKIVDRVMQS